MLSIKGKDRENIQGDGRDKMNRKVELERSVMPLIIVNSIVCTGLFEYFVDRTIRTIGFAYLICCFCFYNFLFFTLRNILGNFMLCHGTELMKIITLLQLFYNPFIYNITILNGFTRRQSIKLFIEQIESCTRGMDELNISENYSSLFRYLCIADVLLIFIILGLCVAEVFWFSEIKLLSSLDYSSILQIYYVDASQGLNLLQNNLAITKLYQMTISRYIKNKFGELNAVLQSMLTTTIDSPQHKRVLRMKDNWEDDSSLSTVYRTYKMNENLVKLKRIKQIYLELMKCARIINEAYGLQIFVSTFSSAVFITTVLYHLYVILMTNNYDSWINQLYVHLFWIFCFSIMIFAKTNICETTITEIRDFMFQLIHNHLNFTACGFYDLNHTFIYGMIGSITTYLVIFIQVGGEPKVFYNNTTYNSTLTK
ncbi:uncharacterized protein LOC118442094 [Vespa mandarinia]|uniref:uncharacterized protein LOC118442094 n=1 Tax=Vespa mandarinia TaxID=7446 RepID=UPI0016171562|nr:uncharacterized protein LOC118442094 [Vespa mandarinia]